MVPMLWHSAQTPNPGTMPWSAQTQEGKILFFAQSIISLFIFPIGLIALDSEPRGRRYVKNMGHNRNCLYSRAIHCPASIEMHYVQWFLHKSMYEIIDCAKN